MPAELSDPPVSLQYDFPLRRKYRQPVLRGLLLLPLLADQGERPRRVCSLTMGQTRGPGYLRRFGDRPVQDSGREKMEEGPSSHTDWIAMVANAYHSRHCEDIARLLVGIQ